MTENNISDLASAIERQNAEFGEVKTALMALDDVELHVPASFVEQLDAIARDAQPSCITPINGLRA